MCIFHAARRTPRAVLLALALLALGVVSAPSAHAHPEFSPSLNNRYLKVSLIGRGELRIAWTLMVGQAPATAARHQADTDGDGTLSDAELQRWTARLADAVRRGLVFDVDGVRVEPTWDAPLPGMPDRRMGPIPFSVDLIGHLRASGPGEHTVRFDDETPPTALGGALGDALGESDVLIEEGPGARVLAAWRGRPDDGRELHYVWHGPKYSVLEDRSVGFRFVDEAPKKRRALPLALAGLLAAAACGALLVVRRRAR